MSTSATFLPWVRRGLAGAIQNTEVDGPDARLTARVKVNQGLDPITRDVRLRGPGHVIGIRRDQIRRVFPAPNVTDAEHDFVPLVEFDAPDLPWAFTPMAADGARLQPWVVLVVVPVGDDVTLSHSRGVPLPALHLTGDAAAALPSLSSSHLWAHVQSDTALDDTETLQERVEDDDPRVFSRLLWPNDLAENTDYLACLVPAFDVGRRAGLGLAVSGTTTLDASWSPGDDEVELPVYHSWSFRTGAAGSFQDLCERLKIGSAPVDLGRQEMLVSQPRAMMADWLSVKKADVLRGGQMAYVGPLKGTQSERDTEPVGLQADMWRNERLRGLLSSGAGARIDREDDPDPIVALPLYGSVPTSRGDFAEGSNPPKWMEQLNLSPDLRAAAGLGAEVVRRHQEEFVAEAWDTVGDAEAAMREIEATRTAGALMMRLALRMPKSRSARVQLASGLLGWVSVASRDRSLAEVMAESQVPRGMLSRAYQRALRPGSAAGRAWRRMTKSQKRAMLLTLGAFLATKPGSPLARFARPRVPSGAVTEAPDLGEDAPPVELPAPGAEPDDGAHVGPEDVQVGFNPLLALLGGLRQRLPFLANRPLPRRLAEAVEIPEPLYDRLEQISPDFALAGIGGMEPDTVVAVSVDSAFVAAFLAGANHEMARELLSRGVPVPLRATFFRQFWAKSGETPADDIKSMDRWSGQKLEDQVTGDMAGDPLIVVVRGALIQRYPTLRFRLAKATRLESAPKHTEPVKRGLEPPIADGRLGESAMWVSFKVSRADARGNRKTRGGNGYYFCIEEEPTEARFAALDASQPNAAEAAAAALKPPSRVFIHVDQLLAQE